MKRHDIEVLLNYGISNYKERLSSSQDGLPNDGKWYHRMDTGFICGDKYTVIRFFSIDNYTVLKDLDE